MPGVYVFSVILVMFEGFFLQGRRRRMCSVPFHSAHPTTSIHFPPVAETLRSSGDSGHGRIEAHEQGQISFYRRRPTPSYKIKLACFSSHDCELPRSSGTAEYTIFGVPTSEVSLLFCRRRPMPHLAFTSADLWDLFLHPRTREPPRSGGKCRYTIFASFHRRNFTAGGQPSATPSSQRIFPTDSHTIGPVSGGPIDHCIYRVPVTKVRFQVRVPHFEAFFRKFCCQRSTPGYAFIISCPRHSFRITHIEPPCSGVQRLHYISSSRHQGQVAGLLPPEANASLQVQSSVTASKFNPQAAVQRRPKSFHNVSNSRDRLIFAGESHVYSILLPSFLHRFCCRRPVPHYNKFAREFNSSGHRSRARTA
ncbi:hypothetical protein C8R43DRAFT_341689 [Mycena crocata]|nr:hypothetical protein C8R43DRAFT_341689 [Mycena crocata]